MPTPKSDAGKTVIFSNSTTTSNSPAKVYLDFILGLPNATSEKTFN